MMIDGLSPSNITNFYLAGCKVRRARTGQAAPRAPARAPRLWVTHQAPRRHAYPKAPTRGANVFFCQENNLKQPFYLEKDI